MATKNETINTPVDDVVDIDLSQLRKKRFRIDGDNNKILELNTSDMGIVARLSESYDKLDKLLEKAQTIATDKPKKKAKPVTDDLDLDIDEDEREEIKRIGDVFSEIDKQMRDLIDYVFDSNVSEVCAPFGNMYDPINGSYRYEIIIETISDLYSDNIRKESEKVRQRVAKHTNKYTKNR